MDQHSNTLAIIYRSIEKWMKDTKGVSTPDQITDLTKLLKHIDEVIKLLRNAEINAISDKYSEFSLAKMLYGRLDSLFTDAAIIRRASAGMSSTGELELAKNGSTVVSLMSEMCNLDVRKLIEIETASIAPEHVKKYLSGRDELSQFDVIVLGIFGGGDRYSEKLEKKKDQYLGAQAVSFDGDHLLARFSRETSYTGKDALLKFISGELRSGVLFNWEDCAPCIVLTRAVGSSIYFDFDALNKVVEQGVGLNNAVLHKYATIVPAEFTSEYKSEVKIYGDKSSPRWLLIDSIDGKLFAIMSRKGDKNIPRNDVLDLLGELPDRAAAYNDITSRVILANCHDPRAKMAIQQYADSKYIYSPEKVLMGIKNALLDSFRTRLNEVTTKEGLIEAISNRQTNYSVVRAAYSDEMTLLASMQRDRDIMAFVRLIERYSAESPPSDALLASEVHPLETMIGFADKVINRVVTEATRMKLFSRVNKTLAEYVSQ